MLVKGILSIAAGKIFSTEDLAERIGISPDLLDVCILISRFSGCGQKRQKYIERLKSSTSFSLFCNHLSLDSNLFLNILKLTFNQIETCQAYDVFASLGI